MNNTTQFKSKLHKKSRKKIWNSTLNCDNESAGDFMMVHTILIQSKLSVLCLVFIGPFTR